MKVVADLIDTVIIPSSWAREDRQGVIVLVAESDSGALVLDSRTRRFAERVSAELLKAFRDANCSVRWWTVESLDVSRTMRCYGSDDLTAMLQSGGWPQVRKEIPGACEILSVSRPGFSADRQTALVYYDIHRGLLSGGGGLVVMRKTPDGWALEDEVLSFVH